MSPRELKVGDVVQLGPAAAPAFRGCLMIVDEPKGFGACGYVQAPGGQQYPYRASWEIMEYVGPLPIHDITRVPL